MPCSCVRDSCAERASVDSLFHYHSPWDIMDYMPKAIEPKKHEVQRRLEDTEFWLDDEKRTQLMDGLREGRDPKVTCEALGISKPEYDRALKEGYRCLLMPYKQRNEREMAMAEFYCEAKGSLMEFERNQVGVILKSAEMGDWKAAAWLLERRMPEMYAKRELPPIRPEVADAPSIKIELVDPTSDSERMLKLERETLDEIDGKVMEK